MNKVSEKDPLCSNKESQQWCDLFFESGWETLTAQISTVEFFPHVPLPAAWWNTVTQRITSKHKAEGKVDRRKERKTAKEEWWRHTSRASCAKPSLPVKQIKLESRGSAAKSRAESESFSGTEIIPHSSVVLTNPGSACAGLAPWDDMTPLKTETGKDSKRRGPDSARRNRCQDDL